MHYLRDRNKKRKKILVVSAVAAVIILFFAGRFGLLRGLSSFFQAIVRPLWKSEINIENNTSVLTGEFRSKASILSENQSLRDENDSLRVELSSLQVIQDENDQLKASMGRTDKATFILGAVITKPPRSLYDTFVVDAGAQAGVIPGAKVYAGSPVSDGAHASVFVGAVSEVYAKSSLVKLFSSAGEKIQVAVSGKNLTTEATGRGGGNFEMTFPHDVEIPKGTQVTALGIDPYLVGIVNDVISDSRDPLQKVLLYSPVNMQELKFVEIEK